MTYAFLVEHAKREAVPDRWLVVPVPACDERIRFDEFQWSNVQFHSATWYSSRSESR